MLSSAASTPNPAANTRRIPIPAGVLSHWLAEIDDPGELKVALRVVALLAPEPNRRGVPPSVTLYDLLDDDILRQVPILHSDDVICQALAATLRRGTLVAAYDRGEVRFFLNDDCCRQYFDKAGLSTLTPADAVGHQRAEITAIGNHSEVPTALPRANIFALYEQHIGTYGHSIAEQLRAAEEEYPAEWVETALEIAAENDKRHWNYVAAILRRWVKEGRHEHGEPGSDTAPDSRTGYLDSYRRRHGRLPWESGEPERR